jgi:hypothetical protein
MTVHAAAISLQNDLSIGNGNPNGQWVYQDNTSNLTLQIRQNNGNPLRPALVSGYWGTGNDLSVNTPDLFKALVNGSSTGESNLDFLTGDIVGHSPNDGSILPAKTECLLLHPRGSRLPPNARRLFQETKHRANAGTEPHRAFK